MAAQQQALEFSRSYCIDFTNRINGECLNCRKTLQHNRAAVIASTEKHYYWIGACCNEACAKDFISSTEKQTLCCCCHQTQVTGSDIIDNRGPDVEISFCQKTIGNVTMVFVCCSQECLDEVQTWSAYTGAPRAWKGRGGGRGRGQGRSAPRGANSQRKAAPKPGRAPMPGATSASASKPTSEFEWKVVSHSRCAHNQSLAGPPEPIEGDVTQYEALNPASAACIICDGDGGEECSLCGAFVCRTCMQTHMDGIHNE